MKNNIVLSFILLFLLCGFISLQSQQDFTVTKDIVVTKDETQDNIITFGGNVLIEGKVEEDIVAFGGSIVVKGEVKGCIMGIGSKITLDSTAIIRGDVYSIGGELNKEPGCVVEGDTVYFKTSEDISKFLKDILSISWIPLFQLFNLVMFFFWFLLSIVLAAMLPRQISFSSSQIKKSFWPIFGIGLLSIIIYIGVTVFSALLSFILIGIPLLFFFVALGLPIQAFGRVVLFYFLGESLLKAFRRHKISPLVAVILGLVLATIIRFIPILGALFSLCLSIIGWGVVIRTKFGTTENWFKKRSQTSN